MGWKAAEKLIRHWKILRGDNVRRLKYISIIFILYYLLFQFNDIYIVFPPLIIGYDNQGKG